MEGGIDLFVTHVFTSTSTWLNRVIALDAKTRLEVRISNLTCIFNSHIDLQSGHDPLQIYRKGGGGVASHATP